MAYSQQSVHKLIAGFVIACYVAETIGGLAQQPARGAYTKVLQANQVYRAWRFPVPRTSSVGLLPISNARPDAA
jgi:hypothetical protein